MGGSEKSRFWWLVGGDDLLGRRVLGDGLRALADGVLGQLAGKQQADGRLDLAARDRRAPIVVRQTRRLGGDALEDVVHEAVHDAHRLAADSRVRMDLFQHLVHVDRVALASPVLPLLVSAASGLRLARCLLRSLSSLRCWFRWHFRVDDRTAIDLGEILQKTAHRQRNFAYKGRSGVTWSRDPACGVPLACQ